MAFRKGERSNWANVINPENILSVKLSTQGDGSGLTDNSIVGVAITAATEATPIVVSATAHGRINGDLVFISGVGGNTNANGLRIVAAKTDNTFALTDLIGEDIASNDTYTSGGLIYPCLWYKVPSTITALIHKFELHAADGAAIGSGYMGLASLTNGMRLEIYKGIDLCVELQANPVQGFSDWAFIGALGITNTGISGPSDVLGNVKGRLTDGLMMLRGDLSESIILIQQDDLSGLLHQEAGISGFLELNS